MLTVGEVMWCARECERQRTGPIEVAYMANALEFTIHNYKGRRVGVHEILQIGSLVEPIIAANGFRQTPVTIDNIAIPVYDFDRVLGLMLGSPDLTPEERYQEFEALHPFIDGNGRVGAILYNHWLGWPNPLHVPPPFRKVWRNSNS